MVELDHLKEVVRPRLEVLVEQVKEDLKDPVKEAQLAVLTVQVLVAGSRWQATGGRQQVAAGR